MTPKEPPNLETFAEAAERGSFTATARQLRISQAAVSQRIQQLETLLGVSLFRREGGHVVLTEAGKQLHTYARRILELTAEACQAVTGAKGEVTGELLLAASSVPGEHLLPERLHPADRPLPVRFDIALGVVGEGNARLAVQGCLAHSGYRARMVHVGPEVAAVVEPGQHPLGRGQ